MKNYFDEYMNASQYGSLLTGTCTAFIKWGDMSNNEKRVLAKNLLWCHKSSNTEPSEYVLEAVRLVLTEEEIKKELEKSLAFEKE
jgi:hypothetical protein